MNNEKSIQICNIPKNELAEYYKILDEKAKNSNNNKLEWIKYLKIGNFVIRILNYSEGFTNLIKNKFDYIITDESDKFDGTIVLWKDNNLQDLLKRKGLENLEIYESRIKRDNFLIRVLTGNGVDNLDAYDSSTNTYYFARGDWFFENDMVKQFVHLLNIPIARVAAGFGLQYIHGAVIGLNDNGVLLCANSRGGKTTLSVSALADKFQFISDDFLLIGKEGDDLYAYPVYSIVNLWNDTKEKLENGFNFKPNFLSKHLRDGKNVYELSSNFDRFAKKLKIKSCIFPKISDVENSSISKTKKDSGIVQVARSTLQQLDCERDIKQMQNIISLLKNFDFYQIKLSPDIVSNVKCLRNFIENY